MSVHIGASKGDIAESVLLPGDPLRAKFIAETFLDAPRQYNEIRNMFGYTGTYRGVPVSVQGTGMGMPSIGIYSWELMTQYDVQNLVRVGTAGSIRADIFPAGWALRADRQLGAAAQIGGSRGQDGAEGPCRQCLQHGCLLSYGQPLL